MGCSPWGHRKSDTTEATQHAHVHMKFIYPVLTKLFQFLLIILARYIYFYPFTSNLPVYIFEVSFL